MLRAETTGDPAVLLRERRPRTTTPSLLGGARGYVSMGHDEYWTPSMRTTVERARDAGTNLAFLGANTMYWRIRLDDRPTGPRRLMTGYRHDAALDPLRDERRRPRRRPSSATRRRPSPENALTGMLYECYPVDADYVVVSPTWWGFAGTGVASRRPRSRGWSAPRPTGSTPTGARRDRCELLSHSSYSCRGVTTTSQSVYYTTPSGAGVFTAGTLRWGCALVDRCERPLGARTRDFARTVTDNLLREFAAGPVGTRHPARDNVARLRPPRSSTRSTRVEPARRCRISHHGSHGAATGTRRGRSRAAVVACLASLARVHRRLR